MAKTIVVAVRDSALEAFSRPVFVPTRGVGVRSFIDEVRRKAEDNPMWKHPEHFSLHVLAEFDDESGEFSNVREAPLAQAINFVEEK